MKALMRAALAFASAHVLAGCMVEGEHSIETANVELRVAPLLLSGVSSVCYDVEVSTAADTVWTRGDPSNTRGGRNQSNRQDAGTVDLETVCSDEFGNGLGGDITYVGPCDASPSADTLPDAAHPGVQNDVTILVDGLYDGGGVDLGQWRDPCPQGCTLSFTCAENQDTLAELNLTIMREADQGFFDIAVNFADIFCSAKLDNCYDGDRHIELLHGADDVRDWTAVFGFACSAGSDATKTNLLYGLVTVDCGSAGTFTLDPTADAGNAHVTVGSNTLHYGVYRGLEQLDCGSGPASCDKAYWNLAISMDDLLSFGGETCTLSLSVTANDDNEGFAAGLPTARGLVYPYIDVDATLTTAGSASCQRHGLDVGTSAVRTAYKGDVLGVPPPVMCSQYDGEVSEIGVCDGSCGVCSCVASMTVEGDGLFASFASSGAAPVWDMGDGTRYTAVTVDHTYAGPGVYQVTATFADGQLATDFGAVSQDLTALSMSSGCTHVVSVNASGSDLSELDLRMLPALRVVNAAYNPRLHTLELGGLAELVRVVANSNPLLTELDLSAASELDYLQVQFAALTSLDLSGKTKLTTLDAYGNPLTHLDITGVTKLTSIALTGTLGSLDLRMMPDLSWVNVAYSALHTLELGGLSKLVSVVANSNSIAALDLLAATELEYLQVQFNALTSLDLSNLSELTFVDAVYNQLTQVTLSNNTALTTLLLSGNPLAGLDVTGAPLTLLQLLVSLIDCDDVVGLSGPGVCVDD